MDGSFSLLLDPESRSVNTVLKGYVQVLETHLQSVKHWGIGGSGLHPRSSHTDYDVPLDPNWDFGDGPSGVLERTGEPR